MIFPEHDPCLLSQTDNGKQKTGVILNIVGVDGLKQTYSLLYAHVHSECHETWLFALGELKKAYGNSLLMEEPFSWMGDLGKVRGAWAVVHPAGIPMSCTFHRSVRPSVA